MRTVHRLEGDESISIYERTRDRFSDWKRGWRGNMVVWVMLKGKIG